MIGGCHEIGANGVLDQFILLMPEIGGPERLNRRPDSIDDGHDVSGAFTLGPLHLVDRGADGATLRVSEYDHQSGVKLLCGEFNAAESMRLDLTNPDCHRTPLLSI